MLWLADNRDKTNWRGIIPYIYASAMSLAGLIGFILCAITYEAMK